MGHGLQVHVGFLLHDQGADLVLGVVHPAIAIDAAVLLGGFGRAGACIEVAIVAFHGHLARVFLVVAHLRILAELATPVLSVVAPHRAIVRAGIRVVVLLPRRVVVVVEATTRLVSAALVTKTVAERGRSLQVTGGVDG